jgi:hypothetical protein
MQLPNRPEKKNLAQQFPFGRYVDAKKIYKWSRCQFQVACIQDTWMEKSTQ